MIDWFCSKVQSTSVILTLEVFISIQLPKSVIIGWLQKHWAAQTLHIVASGCTKLVSESGGRQRHCSSSWDTFSLLRSPQTNYFRPSSNNTKFEFWCLLGGMLKWEKIMFFLGWRDNQRFRLLIDRTQNSRGRSNIFSTLYMYDVHVYTPNRTSNNELLYF